MLADVDDPALRPQRCASAATCRRCCAERESEVAARAGTRRRGPHAARRRAADARGHRAAHRRPGTSPAWHASRSGSCASSFSTRGRRLIEAVRPMSGRVCAPPPRASRTRTAAASTWCSRPTCRTSTARRVDALAGAVGEALNNAGKHGQAHAGHGVRRAGPTAAAMAASSARCTTTAPDSSPTRRREGVGSSRSIRGRMEEVGGRVEIDSRPGTGTEVRLWLP